MSSSTSASHPLVGHFVESTSSTTSSSTISANSALPPPPPVDSEVPQARGKERTRAFSPIRVGSGVKGLFGKKKKAVDVAAGKIEELVVDEGGKREEVVVSSGVVGEVEAAGALVEGGKKVAAAGKAPDASPEIEDVKGEAGKKEEEETLEEKKKIELVDAPLVEPILAPPPPPPQQLVLTPESIAVEDHPTKVNKLESPEPSSFSPVEISLQIKTMLQRFLPDDSELAPPPNQAHLLALLGRPDVMNGEDRDDEDEDESSGLSSVWKCLEHASHDSFCSIMVSCDLDFSTTPVVTLASWMDFGGPSEEGRVMNASSSSAGGWLPSWPWGKKQQPVTPAPGESGGEKVVRVWYPSKTKLSLHATWWGFSIYLPPPIMLVLNDGQKRISALTQGLTFLIKFLPGLLDLGPGMLVALALLGSLVPMISFIASFIAWTWTTVQSYDKGRGVILSATWLCPLLLITRSWDAPSPPSSLIATSNDEKSLLVPVSEVETPLIVVEEVEVVA